MKKNLIKVVSILLVSVMVMSFVTVVNAVDEEDLTSTLLNSSNSSTNNSNTNSLNTNTNNANSNTNNTNTNTKNTNANTSLYNNTNTNLPNTGIGDSIPVAMLVVVFGISAVYAYKKVNDYKNI